MVAGALGWIGTMGTFLAYLLLWKGRVGSESLTYAVMNAFGGLLAGTASVLYGAWPSAASNFVWAAIGIQSAVVTVHRRTGAFAVTTHGPAKPVHTVIRLLRVSRRVIRRRCAPAMLPVHGGPHRPSLRTACAGRTAR